MNYWYSSIISHFVYEDSSSYYKWILIRISGLSSSKYSSQRPRTRNAANSLMLTVHHLVGKEVAQQELPFEKQNHGLSYPRMLGQRVSTGALWITSISVAKDYTRNSDFTCSPFPLIHDEAKTAWALGLSLTSLPLDLKIGQRWRIAPWESWESSPLRTGRLTGQEKCWTKEWLFQILR